MSRLQPVHRQLHAECTTFGIGSDRTSANSWLLRSPGILSRRVLRRFLLPGGSSRTSHLKQMRNPSHQLNDELGAKDMPDHAPPATAAHAHTVSDDQSRSFGQVRKERLGNAGKSSSPLHRDGLEIAKHASQYAGRIACTGTALPEAAVFEADCTECKRRSSARAADQSGGVAFACAERAATIFRIITIKRF
jgi:hypothetical protein